MFHPLRNLQSNIQLPTQFTCPFCYTPHPLVLAAANGVKKYIDSRTDWNAELSHEGKMFGVLIVQQTNGEIGFVSAFSGNLDGKNRHSFFVPPIFDVLNPDGYFKKEESRITELNKEIKFLQNSTKLADLQQNLTTLEIEAQNEITAQRNINKQHKAKRDESRKTSNITDNQATEFVRQSQFEKAELRRIEQRWKNLIDNQKQQITLFETEIEQKKAKRRQMSEALQQWLFEQYVVLNARGEQKNILQIFADERGTLPPAATGECAAPKMLQFAFQHHLKPIAMGEFWYGGTPESEIRRHGQFYAACHSRCQPLLHFMLQGIDVEPNRLEEIKSSKQPIEILYDDAWLVAINKPAGLLSVPGKDDADSALQQVQNLYNKQVDIQPVHRLDMQTSGVLLFAKSKQMQATMMQMFEQRKVKKQYLAIVDGIPTKNEGVVSLPLFPDFDNRPLQKVDFENGKTAISHYKVLKISNGKSLIKFYPETGRTHQLRIHAAHKLGLNCPIVGDNLYGTIADRLHLYAEELEFTHPITNEQIKIRLPKTTNPNLE